LLLKLGSCAVVGLLPDAVGVVVLALPVQCLGPVVLRCRVGRVGLGGCLELGDRLVELALLGLEHPPRGLECRRGPLGRLLGLEGGAGVGVLPGGELAQCLVSRRGGRRFFLGDRE